MIFSLRKLNANVLPSKIVERSPKLKSTANEKNIVTIKNKAIGITMPNGVEASMSGGIISKILYDSLVSSSLAAAIAPAKQPCEDEMVAN